MQKMEHNYFKKKKKKKTKKDKKIKTVHKNSK